jgi:glutathione S-transferase
MKLYYSPGACSLSPHIVLREAGMTFDVEKVDLKTKTTATGADFTKVNPKGQVPTLQLDSGEILTEGPVIVQYIADQNPGAGLAGAAGTMERYRVQEWLNFITSELHKGFSPLFRPNTPDAYKEIAKANLAAKFDAVEKHLAASRT